jgi:predicted small lipoprotein YifL
LTGLRAGLLRQGHEKFTLSLGVLPQPIYPAVMKATGFASEPNFMQWLLLIDDDLALVCKGQRHHASHALVVYICIGTIVNAITALLYCAKQCFRLVHKFRVSHYNSTMFEATRILIRLWFMGGSVVYLVGCGQTGPLYLPVQTPPTKAVAASDLQKESISKQSVIAP